MIKMANFLQILLVFTISLITLEAQEHAASLSNAPVGSISRTGFYGNRETYSSLGNAPVGVYQKQEHPDWRSQILPIPVDRPIPVYRPIPVDRPFPVYRPIYHPVYQPIFPPVFQPILQEGLLTKPKPVVKIKVSKSVSQTSPVKKVISSPNTPRGGLLGNLLGGGLLG